MRFIFLVYVPRSGSTFLANLMQEEFADVVSVPEVAIVERVIKLGDGKVKGASRKRLEREFYSDPQMISYTYWSDRIPELAEIAANCGVRAFIERLVEIHAEANGLSGDIAVIKKGSLIFSVDDVRDLFGNMAFLYIHRDPRAVVNSMIRAVNPHTGGTSFARRDTLLSARYYMKVERMRSAIVDKDVNLLTVSYERLVEHSQGEMDRIADWYGLVRRARKGKSIILSEDERMLHRSYSKRGDRSKAINWRRTMSPMQIALVEGVTNEAMEKLGYDPIVWSTLRLPSRVFVMVVGVLRFFWNSALHAITIAKRKITE